MSLKSFHIVFVTFTFLMSLFFALWSFKFTTDSSFMTSCVGWCGIIGLLVAPIYGIYFWKKSTKIIL